MAWKDVESNPDYQSLSPDGKVTAKTQYFEQKVTASPDYKMLSPEGKEKARRMFLGGDAPGYKEPTFIQNLAATGEELAKEGLGFVRKEGATIAGAVTGAAELAPLGAPAGLAGMAAAGAVGAFVGGAAGKAIHDAVEAGFSALAPKIYPPEKITPGKTVMGVLEAGQSMAEAEVFGRGLGHFGSEGAAAALEGLRSKAPSVVQAVTDALNANVLPTPAQIMQSRPMAALEDMISRVPILGKRIVKMRQEQQFGLEAMQSDLLSRLEPGMTPEDFGRMTKDEAMDYFSAQLAKRETAAKNLYDGMVARHAGKEELDTVMIQMNNLRAAADTVAKKRNEEIYSDVAGMIPQGADRIPVANAEGHAAALHEELSKTPNAYPSELKVYLANMLKKPEEAEMTEAKEATDFFKNRAAGVQKHPGEMTPEEFKANHPDKTPAQHSKYQQEYGDWQKERDAYEQAQDMKRRGVTSAQPALDALRQGLPLKKKGDWEKPMQDLLTKAKAFSAKAEGPLGSGGMDDALAILKGKGLLKEDAGFPEMEALLKKESMLGTKAESGKALLGAKPPEDLEIPAYTGKAEPVAPEAKAHTFKQVSTIISDLNGRIQKERMRATPYGHMAEGSITPLGRRFQDLKEQYVNDLKSWSQGLPANIQEEKAAADNLYSMYKKTFSNEDMVRLGRMGKEALEGGNPEALYNTFVGKNNVSRIKRLKAVIGEEGMAPMRRIFIDRLVTGPDGKVLLGKQISQNIARLGKPFLKEMLSSEQYADLVAGAKEAKLPKFVENEVEKRLRRVIFQSKDLTRPDEEIAKRIINGDSETAAAVSNILSPKQMQPYQRAIIEAHLLEPPPPGTLKTPGTINLSESLKAYGPNFGRIVPKEMIEGVERVERVKALLESGRKGASQASKVAGGIGAAEVLLNPVGTWNFALAHPVGIGSSVLSAYVVSRLYTSEVGRRLLIEGMSPGSLENTVLASRLAAFVINAGREEQKEREHRITP